MKIFKSIPRHTRQQGLIPLLILGAGALAVLFPGAVGWVVSKVAESVAFPIIAWVFDILAGFANKVMVLSGVVMDNAINFTLGTNIGNLDAVRVGWSVARDVSNMFFIFIILFIAIATILQLSSYGIKQLLLRVVIVALLINFSLMVTRVIYDVSNALGMTFYTSMKISNGSVSAGIAKGLEIQKMALEAKGGDISNEILIVTSLFAILIYLATAYAFFVGTLIFVVRMIAFTFLMIFAPVAFLAMAFPAAGSSISKRWWDAVFKQAAVVPAFMFLLYIVIRIISDGVMKGLVNISAVGRPELTAPLVLNLIIILGLVIGSVKVAKEVGGKISAGAISLGNTLGAIGLGLGAAAITRVGVGALSDTKKYAGAGAEKVMQSDNKYLKRIRESPIGSRTIARASTWKTAADAEKVKKLTSKYGTYSDEALSLMKRHEKKPEKIEAMTYVTDSRKKKSKELVEGSKIATLLKIKEDTVQKKKDSETKKSIEKAKKAAEKIKKSFQAFT